MLNQQKISRCQHRSGAKNQESSCQARRPESFVTIRRRSKVKKNYIKSDSTLLQFKNRQNNTRQAGQVSDSTLYCNWSMSDFTLLSVFKYFFYWEVTVILCYYFIFPANSPSLYYIYLVLILI